MKRTCLLSTAAILATLTSSSVAMAEVKPAVIWIPTADVEAIAPGTVDSVCQKTTLNGSAIAAGCIPGVEESSTLSPHPMAQDIVDGVTAAFAAYDLRVVTEPPAEYLPTFALFTGAEASKENDSYSCTSVLPQCGARSRDTGYFAFLDGTNQCTDPDIVAAAVFATGLLSGLEGKEDAGSDWMNYPPDYTMPGTEFVDECGAIAPRFGGKDGMTEQPLDCTSLDHAGCETGEQNSNADLLENLGAAGGDEDAPVITVQTPADGDVIAAGDPLRVDVGLEEASNYAGIRIIVSSPALDGLDGITGGEISFCTTDLCDINFLENEPFKKADSGWSTGDVGLPGGDYTITVEASDYYGNEAETVTLSVSIEGGGGDGGETDGGGDDGGGDDGGGDDGGGDDGGDDGGFASDGNESSGGDTDGSGGASDDGGGGCSVAGSRDAGGLALMFGLLGLGFVRRRR